MLEIKGLRKIKHCRLCDSVDFSLFFDFGFVPLGNNLLEDKNKSGLVEEYPLHIVRCKNCHHFQLMYAVDPNLLYATNYTYLSGIGKSFVKHMVEYVDWVQLKCNLNSSSSILEIGSNDGSCLEIFKNKGYKVCGVDPAELPCKIANKKGVPTINDFFNQVVADQVISEFGYFDLVTSQNALAHVDNLKDTFTNIKKVLKNDGFLVFEIGYFKDVLDTGCFDTTYHEHLDYHHAAPLSNHLNKIGFQLVSLETNKVQGGSLRVLAKKTKKIIVSKEVTYFLKNEKESILYDDILLKEWKKKILYNSKKIHDLIINENKLNTLCFGFGAPTKSVLLLKMLKLNDTHIDFIVEDNLYKINKYLPKIKIPILSPSSIDYNKSATIIILAWNFADDIIDKLKKSYKVPFKIIIPLPEVKVLNL